MDYSDNDLDTDYSYRDATEIPPDLYDPRCDIDEPVGQLKIWVDWVQMFYGSQEAQVQLDMALRLSREKKGVKNANEAKIQIELRLQHEYAMTNAMALSGSAMYDICSEDEEEDDL